MGEGGGQREKGERVGGKSEIGKWGGGRSGKIIENGNPGRFCQSAYPKKFICPLIYQISGSGTLGSCY